VEADEDSRNAHGLTDEEILDVCGPSWAGMSSREREEYGPLFVPSRSVHRVATVFEASELVQLAVRFPEGVWEHGVEPVARACLASTRVVELAAMVDAWNRGSEDEVLALEVDNVLSPAFDDARSAKVRVAAWERDLAIGLRSGAAA
jgi:hypothetical protein